MSRLRDRTNVLTRPEFISLNQPLRREPDPRRRGGGHQEDGGARPSEGAPNGGVKEERWPEQDCMQLNPSLRGIAVNSLLAIDISLSKRLVLALSGHFLPWILISVISLWSSNTAAGQEVMINLLMALVLDLMTVAGLQKLFKRRGPWDLPPGFLDYIAMDTYSFPAAHASRAILVSKFLLNHLVLAVPLRILLYLWALLVGVSRVLLGKHHLSDVGCGFALGFLHFSLLESVWLDASTCQTLLSISTMSWTGPSSPSAP
ncbi:Inactive phospholipid phosphatase 7 [Dissostichus eleginoides]|uniref:Inactive phospholipid phosphatase 7 n=1 Tax=Dissostichus eleginoides TaxID=100907 RepID=A0AAD9C2C0_DISEL|nr:Inactive phospholipid phosphatase 7 [Dissostichus eleginoides]